MSDRDAKKAKERRNLAKRWAEEQAQSGGSSSCVRIPDGMEMLKLAPTGKDPLAVDFVPFIAGAHNKRADPGEEAIDVTYVRHWVPSLSGKNQPVACRAACFGKRCAVCDWLRNNGKTADEEQVKLLRPQTRHLFLVNDKPGNVKNPLKILDTNDKNKGMGFAELLADACATLGEDVDPFALDEGCTAFIIVKEQTGGSFKYNGATRIDFRQRDYSYPASMLQSNPCLDDLIVDPGYDEVMAMLEPPVEDKPGKVSNTAVSTSRNGHDTDEEEEEDTPTSSTAEHNFQAGDEVKYEGETHTIKRVKDNGKLVLKDEDGGITNDVDTSECEAVTKTKGRAPAKDEEDEEQDPDFDDDSDFDDDEDMDSSDETPAKGKTSRR